MTILLVKCGYDSLSDVCGWLDEWSDEWLYYSTVRQIAALHYFGRVLYCIYCMYSTVFVRCRHVCMSVDRSVDHC